MLSEMLRREKRYGTAATWAAIGIFMLFVALLILVIALAPDALPGLLCCCIFPLLFVPSLAVVMYMDRYGGNRSMDRLLQLSRYGDVDSLIDQIDSEWAQSQAG